MTDIRPSEDLPEELSDVNSKVNTKTKIFYSNVQCLRNKITLLETVLQPLSVSCVCLSEHWLHRDEVNAMCLKGFKLMSVFCRKSSKNGGAMIYVKDSFKATTINVHEFNSDKDFEAAAIKYDGLKGQTVIVCVYRSPLGQFEVFIEQMHRLLHHLSRKNTRFVICGDFIVNMTIHGPKQIKLLDLCRSFGLHMTVQAPTRVTKDSTSCIDNVFTNIADELSTFSSEVVDLGIADHKSIICTIKEDTKSKKYNFVTKRFFTKQQVANFELDLSTSN